MALGQQFDRTYYTDHDGNTTFFGPTDASAMRWLNRIVYSPIGQVAGHSTPLGEYVDHPDGRRTFEATPHQGLLFHPSTGTGAGHDPLMEDTAPLIRDALGLGDRDRYDRRAGRLGADYDTVASEAVNAVKGTSMPPHVLEYLKHDVKPKLVVSAREGRSFAEDESITMHQSGGKTDWPALVHEIGHTMEGPDTLSQNRQREGSSGWVKPGKVDPYTGRAPYVGMPARPDPRSEGVADGISDRFTRLASARDDIASLHAGTGYSTQFSGFRDNASRALYSAARLHSSMSDLGAADVPSREQLMEDAGLYSPNSRAVTVSTKSGRYHRVASEYHDLARSKVIADSSANSLLLGHLAHHNPAIVPHLEAQGFGKATQDALSMYHQHFPQYAPTDNTPAEPDHEQLSLNFGKRPKRK